VPADATAARTTCPEADVRWTPRLSRVPWESHAFDAVVVRERPEWSGSLVGPTVRDALASLLSVVRPGGRLIVAQRLPGGKRGGWAAHAAACHAQSLEPFPGRTSLHFAGDGVADPGAWRWLLGFGARPGWQATVHRVPLIPVSAGEWSRCAGAVLSAAPCCAYGAQAAAPETEPSALPRRRAA
jgi:SAM-dependent methyltransferase